MVKILRKSYENHETQFPKFSAFIGQKSIFCHYCIQDFKMEFKFKYEISILNV